MSTLKTKVNEVKEDDDVRQIEKKILDFTNNKNYDNAIPLLFQLLERYPNNEKYNRKLGVCFGFGDVLKNKPLCLKYCRKAIEISKERGSDSIQKVMQSLQMLTKK